MSEQAREVLNDAEMALQAMKANVVKSEKDFEVIAKAVAERDGWKGKCGALEKDRDSWKTEAERWRKVAGENGRELNEAAERLVKADAYIAELESPKESQKVTEDFAGKWLQQAYVAHEEVEGRHVVTEDCGNAGVVPCQKILDELFAGLDDGIDVSGDSHKMCGATHHIVDMVNHPPHYKRGSVECIDAIQAALTDEEFRGYCKGNALKYCWRERHKGGSEDLKKAVWYLERGAR